MLILRLDFHSFAEKVEFATIVLHNFMFAGNIHQIGRYFHIIAEMSSQLRIFLFG